MHRSSSRKLTSGEVATEDQAEKFEKTKLVDCLKPLLQLLQLCGCGTVTSTHAPLRLAYFCWTRSIFATLVTSFLFQLIRLVFLSEWTKLDLDKALTIIVLVWQLQVVFTASVATYLARDFRYDRFDELWRRCQQMSSYEQKSVRWLRYVQVLLAVGSAGFSSLIMGACLLQNYDLIEKPPAIDLAKHFNVSTHFNNFYCASFGIDGLIWAGTLSAYALICFATGALAGSLSDEITAESLNPLCRRENQLSLIAKWSDKHLKLVTLGQYCSTTFSWYTACMIATNIPLQITLLYILVVDITAPVSLRVNCVIWQCALFCQLWCILSAAHLHSKFSSISESFALWYGRETSRKRLSSGDEDLSKVAEMELHCNASGFLARCQTLEVGVTAASLFTITRGSILTIFSVVISYFTILTQFAQSTAADAKVVEKIS